MIRKFLFSLFPGAAALAEPGPLINARRQRQRGRPALDGIAKRKEADYIKQSILEPNAKLAEGFEKLGVSPMPPMGKF